MTTAIIGVISIFLAILLSRPITTFVHELGHAIPALLFTEEPVVIYIGSYGDINNSTITEWGRLKIVFKFNLSDLQLGLCSHSGAPHIWQSLIIVLGGPIFSLLLGLVAVLLLLNFKEDQFIAFTIGIFITSGLLDFLVNVIPSKTPLEMYDGHLIDNDGSQFLQILKSSRYPESYFEAMELLNKKQDAAAIDKLKETIQQGAHDLSIYQLTMKIFLNNKQPEKAIAFYDEYGSHFKLSSSDLVTMGKLYEAEDFSMKAIAYYSKAIQLDYTNKSALALRGKLLLSIGKHEEGQADLTKVEMMEGKRSVRK